MSRLALGTVQFGSDYGINNLRGRIPKNEVFEILELALAAGIDTLDTAYAYGGSEEVVGEYIKQKGKSFRIVSKLPKIDPAQAPELFKTSLKRLGVDSLYGYIIHDFNQFRDDPTIWEKLKELKAQQKVKKIGFSLYYPTDLEQLISAGIEFDLVQIPYNVFDRRFEPYFQGLKERKVEIHVRSVFLQGLVFKKPEKLNGVLAGMQNKLETLGRIARDNNKSMMEIALGFALANKLIDGVVLGVDNINNLEEIIAAEKQGCVSGEIMKGIKALIENNEDYILPFNWGKESKIADKRGK